MKRLVFVLLPVMMVVLCAGCKPKQVEQPLPPPPPPEPSMEELAGKIRPKIDPLKAEPFQEAALQQVLDDLKAAKSENQGKSNGPAAVTTISHEIVDIATAAEKKKEWKRVLACVSAYELMDPESKRLERTKNMATLQINKPRVTVKGFYVDRAAGDQLYVFLEVFDPKTNKAESWKARVGEEKNNLRLVDIVGDQKGVTMEYSAIPGDLFDVMM